jgi:hypothetical protein
MARSRSSNAIDTSFVRVMSTFDHVRHIRLAAPAGARAARVLRRAPGRRWISSSRRSARPVSLLARTSRWLSTPPHRSFTPKVLTTQRDFAVMLVVEVRSPGIARK